MPHEIEERLPEADFVALMRYASRRMLPVRRLELMLARVCLTVAQSQGAKGEAGAPLTLSDFLFEPPSVEDEPTEAADNVVALRQHLGFRPRNPKKRGRAHGG